jgi:hypothetical protein
MNPTRAPSNASAENTTMFGLRGLCRWGGYGAFALLLYSVATMVQMAVIGMGAPSDPAGIFAMLHEHPVEGLLRLDLPVILAMPLYYLVFLGLFAALRHVDLSNSILSLALAFAGITLVVATPTALPMLRLSEMYSAATTDAQRAEYLAAGQAVMVSDVWHHTGAVIGAILLQFSAVLICCVMLKGVFSKATAWLGITMHGLDLLHLLCGRFVPTTGMVLMAIAGLIYPFWFFLIGRRLLQLASNNAAQRVDTLVSAG